MSCPLKALQSDSSPEYEVEEIWDGNEWRVVRKVLTKKAKPITGRTQEGVFWLKSHISFAQCQ